MEIMARTIAQLRRERGLTQDALAERIGVSPQTVSKWENQATCPDVALLPVLADVFGVRIDALFGREEGHASVTPEQAIERVIESARETFVAACYEPERDGRFEEQLAQYKRAMTLDARHRSVIESDRDVLYFREELGVMALRRPADGWNTLFARADVADFLRLAADDDFRRAMQAIISRRMLTFTLPSLAKQCGIDDSTSLRDKLLGSGMFTQRQLVIDEAPLTYYEMTVGEGKLFLLYAALAFAQELVDYQGVHYCFFGNMNYFTP